MRIFSITKPYALENKLYILILHTRRYLNNQHPVTPLQGKKTMKKVIKTSVAIIATFAISACQTTSVNPEKRAAVNYRGTLYASDDANQHCRRTAKQYYTSQIAQGKNGNQAYLATSRYVSLAYSGKNVTSCRRDLTALGAGSSLLNILSGLTSK